MRLNLKITQIGMMSLNELPYTHPLAFNLNPLIVSGKICLISRKRTILI